MTKNHPHDLQKTHKKRHPSGMPFPFASGRYGFEKTDFSLENLYDLGNRFPGNPDIDGVSRFKTP
jgi:hypothetical protein